MDWALLMIVLHRGASVIAPHWEDIILFVYMTLNWTLHRLKFFFKRTLVLEFQWWNSSFGKSFSDSSGEITKYILPFPLEYHRYPPPNGFCYFSTNARTQKVIYCFYTKSYLPLSQSHYFLLPYP